MKRLIWCIVLFMCSAYSHGHTLKVFQINLWNDATMVPGGMEGLTDEIAHLQPDVILMCEIRDYGNKSFITRLQQALEAKNAIYPNGLSEGNVGILSKFKLTQEELQHNDTVEAGAILKARMHAGGKEIVLYSAHLDYTYYACYQPRGYDGVSWKKLNAPVTDPETVEQLNNRSLRDEAIRQVIEDAEQEKEHLLILGGDFNEPSHLDWTKKTRHLWDHNNTVINWICSALLRQAGFKDSYRIRYPNPVTHPGFTYGIDNPAAPLEKLDWVPEADGRDRIDYIYYHPTKGIKLTDAMIVGPSGYIVRGQRIRENTQDKIHAPHGIWPSDHNGVLAIFEW